MKSLHSAASQSSGATLGGLQGRKRELMAHCGLSPILQLWVHWGREVISEEGALWGCNG